jgi:hypothetical protein
MSSGARGSSIAVEPVSSKRSSIVFAIVGATPHRTSSCAKLTGRSKARGSALRKNAALEPENLSTTLICTRGPRRALNSEFIETHPLHNGVGQAPQIGYSKSEVGRPDRLDMQAAQF